MTTERKRCCPLRTCAKTQEPEISKPMLVPHVIEPDTADTTKDDPKKSESSVSSFVKGGIGLMVPATVDMVVAFSTSYWATYTVEHSGVSGGYGLWKVWRCAEAKAEVTDEGAIIINEEKSCQEKLADTTFPAWHIAIQVMMTISLAGMLSSFIMLLLYIFWSRWHHSKKIMSIIISISYFSGLNLLVSLFVFGFKASEEIEMMNPTGWLLSWSFSLACTAFVMNQISASILITENKRLSWDGNGNNNGAPQYDDDDDDSALPIYVPEPQRAVFVPEGSIRVKDLKIGPPPKKVPPLPPLEGVLSEDTAVAVVVTYKKVKNGPPPPPSDDQIQTPPKEIQTHSQEDDSVQSGKPFSC